MIIFQVIARILWGFHHRGFGIVALLSMIALAQSGAAQTCDIRAPAAESRTILAVYDGHRVTDPRFSDIHRHLELPLNHLGYRLVYQDISDLGSAESLPAELAADLVAVVGWFDGPLPSGDDYARWATRIAAPCGSAVRVLALGHPGVAMSGPTSADSAAYLDRLGLRAPGYEQAVGHLSRIASADPAMIGAEADFLLRPAAYPDLQAQGGAQSHLRIAARPGPDEGGLDLVVIGPRGAFAQQDALLSRDDRLAAPMWILDPFAFLTAALAPAGGGAGAPPDPRPVPDVTTMQGLRLFFATVGAEGWLTEEPARQIGETVMIGAERLERDLIAPNGDLPVTVAVLTGDLDPAMAGPLAGRGLGAAERILALPDVAPATNGRVLVRDWPAMAVAGEDAAAPEGATLVGNAIRVLGGDLTMGRGRVSAHGRTKYPAGTVLPTVEIGGAVEVTARLARRDRNKVCVLWPDGALPPAEALESAWQTAGCAIGGGAYRSDSDLPLLGNLVPLAATVGTQLQVYSPMGSDSSFGSLSGGTRADDGFHGLLRMAQWSESPRRLAALQLSYDAGAALGFGARSTVRRVLDEVRAGPFLPVTARRYVAAVQGFQTVRLARQGALAWAVEDRGGLQTLRFDDAGGLALALDASSGVLGANRAGEHLYVALDPADPRPVVALAHGAAPSGVATTGAQVALVSATVPVAARSHAGCLTDLRLEPVNRAGRMLLQGAPDSDYEVRIAHLPDPATAESRALWTGADGLVPLDLPALTSAVSITAHGACEGSI